MPVTFTLAQIEHLKLRAKFVSRSNSISHSVALDQLAHENGFSNWSLLMKHAVPADEIQIPSKYLRFTRTAEEMRSALRTVPETRYNFNSRVEEAERQARDIHEEFGSALNAVDFAVAYVTCLLTVPRFRVDMASRVYWELRVWLPYEVHALNENTQVLVNRRYKPVGKGGTAWVDYEEFAHLQTRFNDAQLDAIAHRPTSHGYLYNDGCSPWGSRKNAERYLKRLHKLQAFLGH